MAATGLAGWSPTGLFCTRLYFPEMTRQCAVFVSSTSEDLREYRIAAREAVLAVGLRPEMMEYFAAAGGGPLGECLGRVSPCDVVVVIVAERYGCGALPSAAGCHAGGVSEGVGETR